MKTRRSASIDRAALMQALRQAGQPPDTGALLHALGLGPQHKAALRDLLHSMALEGAFTEPGLADKIRGLRHLPLVSVVVITGTDRNGAPVARPEAASLSSGEAGRLPVVFMARALPGRPPLSAGTRVLARLKPLGAGRFEGRTLRVLDDAETPLIGLLQPAQAGYRIEPVSSRTRGSWQVDSADTAGSQAGDFVVATPISYRQARVVRTLGRGDAPGTASLISIIGYNLPETFPDDVQAEADACEPVDVAAALNSGRSDLRDIPFVTVDGPDSRDFDDAIWAEREGDGFRLLVAIADVAHYVRPGSALDREARDRGQSVYFADRVIPMLPARLSDDLCSLRPDADRLCVIFDIRLDADGHQTAAQIRRGLMRSRMRLTYDQLQMICDGNEAVPACLSRELIETFRAAHAVLSRQRANRGALVMERSEIRVTTGAEMNTLTLEQASAHESHRLIENFMLQANSAAARLMKDGHLPGLYRCHPAPADPERVRKELLAGTAGRDRHSLPAAFYSSDPSPHFALALDSYAHVTSPIRRYADLVCHRALLDEPEHEAAAPRTPFGDLVDLARHLSFMENRTACATRDAHEKLLALYLSRHTNLIFTGHVTGETPFGALVTLTEPELTGLLAVSPAVSETMASDLNRVSRKYPDRGTFPYPSSGLLCPKKGTAVRVRPAGLRQATFQCIFLFVDTQS